MQNNPLVEDYWNYFKNDYKVIVKNEKLTLEILSKRLNLLFYYYLNNPYSIKQFLHTPFNRVPISPYLQYIIDDYYNILNLINYNNFKNNVEIEEKLIICYQILKMKIEKLRLEEYRRDFSIAEQDFKGPAKKYLHKIKNFVTDKLQGDFILISSLATSDYKWNWSDFDSVYFLNECDMRKNSLKDLQKSFLKLNAMAHMIDIHQDHGIFIVLPFQKFFYSENLMPVKVLEKGICLNKRKLIVKLNIIESDWEDKAAINNLKKESKSFSKKSMNLYAMKRFFLHRVFLLPSIILQNTDKSCYKKESFHKIKEFYKENEIAFIDDCSNVYHNWFHNRFYRNFLTEILLITFPMFMPLFLKFIYRNEKVDLIEKLDLEKLTNEYKKFLNNYEL